MRNGAIARIIKESHERIKIAYMHLISIIEVPWRPIYPFSDPVTLEECFFILDDLHADCVRLRPLNKQKKSRK